MAHMALLEVQSNCSFFLIFVNSLAYRKLLLENLREAVKR